MTVIWWLLSVLWATASPFGKCLAIVGLRPHGPEYLLIVHAREPVRQHDALDLFVPLRGKNDKKCRIPELGVKTHEAGNSSARCSEQVETRAEQCNDQDGRQRFVAPKQQAPGACAPRGLHILGVPGMRKPDRTNLSGHRRPGQADIRRSRRRYWRRVRTRCPCSTG
jgi:hypothetical protein